MENGYSLKQAVVINAAGKYSTIILQVIVNAILGRILSADDYGIVAIITVFSTFFSLMSDMGFSTAIIQRKDLTEEDINSVFSVTIIVGLILAVSFCGFGYIIALFYQDEVFIRLSYMLAVSLFFNTINMAPNGVVNREKKFISMAIRTFTSYAIAATIAVVLAKNGWGYSSIIQCFK